MIGSTDPSTVMIETVAIMVLAVVGLLCLVGIAMALNKVFKWNCEHRHVRCVHGDEIIQTRFRRVRCRDCGRALDLPLPAICTFTGQPHVGRLEGT